MISFSQLRFFFFFPLKQLGDPFFGEGFDFRPLFIREGVEPTRSWRPGFRILLLLCADGGGELRGEFERDDVRLESGICFKAGPLGSDTHILGVFFKLVLLELVLLFRHRPNDDLSHQLLQSSFESS